MNQLTFAVQAVAVFWFCEAVGPAAAQNCKLEGGFRYESLLSAVWYAEPDKDKCEVKSNTGGCSWYLQFCNSLKVNPCGPNTACEVGSTLQDPQTLGTFKNLTSNSYDSFVAHFESEPNRNVSVTKCQGILKTNLVFKCDAAKDISIGNDTLLAKLPFDGIKGSDDCERNLTVPFSGACGTKPAAASAGLSAGSVLLILFFVGVLLYLVGGVILKHNSGARGWEMLPHQQFWSELPSLIVEGCVYFVKLVTCQATSGTGANRSYDDI
ncbi:unnamed protein product [Ixodes persulcatus]